MQWLILMGVSAVLYIICVVLLLRIARKMERENETEHEE
jgi:hypothetical protein